MSTNSTIGICEGNTVTYIYCHWDGYPEKHGVGETLCKHYMDAKKVKALIALGNVSSLKARIDCPDGHTFGNSEADCTIFYSRDRGETGQAPNVCDYVKHQHNDYEYRQYNYLFMNSEWYMKVTRSPCVKMADAYPEYSADALAALDVDKQRVEEYINERNASALTPH